MRKACFSLSKKNKEKGFIAASIENFWYYYKWPFLGGILIFFAVLIGLTMMEDTKKPSDVEVLSVFARPLTMQEYTLQEPLKDVIQDTDGDGEKSIFMNSLYISESGKSDNDKIAASKFSSAISYAQGDLILMDKTNIDRFSKKDFFAPLEDYLDLSVFPEEDLYYRDDVAIAVRLSDSQILTDMQFIVDSVYAGIMFVPDEAEDTLTLRRESAAEMIQKLTIKAPESKKE